MNVSSLIAELQRLQEKHGDLPVYIGFEELDSRTLVDDVDHYEKGHLYSVPEHIAIQ